MEKKIKSGSVRYNKDETALTYRIYLEDQKGRVPETIWFGKEVGTTRTAKATLKHLFPKKIDFATPKPPEIIEKIIQIMADNDGDIFLDFYAGSGATGHAVIRSSFNSEVDLRYVLIEMGKYFESLTKPRIQKVIYTEKWKDGKPLDNDGSRNHIFNPNFPLENSQGQVMQPDTLEALAHRPLNQARFFLGRDNSK